MPRSYQIKTVISQKKQHQKERNPIKENPILKTREAASARVASFGHVSASLAVPSTTTHL